MDRSDELAHAEKSAADPMEELRILTEMWIRKLEKAGSSVESLKRAVASDRRNCRTPVNPVLCAMEMRHEIKV